MLTDFKLITRFKLKIIHKRQFSPQIGWHRNTTRKPALEHFVSRQKFS